MSPAFTGLLDDAAIFPPGNSPLEDAVPAFFGRRTEPWADLVGSFVVSDHKMPDLRPLVGAEELPVSVVIGAGAGGIAPAASAVDRLDGLRLAGLEVALRDPSDLVGNARRVIAGLDQARDLGLVDDEVVVCVELPQEAPGAGWLAAADEIAAADLHLKFRTGGVEAHLFPSPDVLGAWITAALDRECAFKCTAGLHNAVRHTDPETGFAHHGFLNVLLATRASLDGDDPVAVLTEDDPAALTARFHEHGHDTMARTRRWFTGFGSCSVVEPLDDLHALGLLTKESA
ncbi:hypothetical protein ASD66_18100 [Nocardioides sp. Root151]|nr:hypothetical protein ASD30_11345 [Nocardioides sp. Root140]KQZ67668.1 hypothetical protein ASD66_18100 [Nocardioides sp. Root151]KRF13223.1 hypothetical protein ASH02_15990 [Nocardioides sp. Soil796]